MKFNKKWLLILLVALIPAILILPGMGQIAYFSGSEFSDVAISHYPNLVFLKHSLMRDHAIPLWYPGILSGYPFDADPLSGLWYPPGWLALLLPLPAGINLVVWLHIVLGGLGLYFFLRRTEYEMLPAVLGAILFVSLPKIYAHFGAGHITYLFAVSLTPWLMLVTRGTRTRRRWWQALLFGMTALADLRWLPFSLAAMLAVEWRNETQNHLRKVLFSLVPAVAGLGLAAVLLLPLFQFTGLSTRSLLTAADNQVLSLPPVNLLNMLFSTPSGTAEWVVYCGAGVFLLALIGLFSDRKHWTRVWGLVWLLCVVWSLGSHIPGLSFIAKLPGLNLMRVPPRAMFLGNLAMVLLAVEGLRWVLTVPDSKIWKPIRLTIIAVGLFSALFAVLSISMVGEKARGIQISAEVAVGTVILIESYRASRGKWQLPLLITIFVLDCVLAAHSSFLYRPRPDSVSIRSIETILAGNTTGNERIYSPSYSIPQDLAADYDWQLAGGINPLQLKTYVKYLATASGVPATSYSVVQPPLATGNPGLDNQASVVDVDALKRLNVTWVASAYPMTALDPYLKVQEGSGYLYQIGDTPLYPRLVTDNELTISVKVNSVNANELVFYLDGTAGRLETSEICYPGWIASIDGQPAEIAVQDGLFRSVEVPAGASELRMVYRPTLLYVGAMISLLWLAAWLISFRWVKR